jgi:dimethylargininase
MSFSRQFTIALTRQVPTTLPQGLTTAKSAADPLLLSVAQRQHEKYTTALRSIVPTLTLPQNPSHPDCVFIEDTAVVIGRTAIINRIRAASRQGEIDPVKDVLLQLGVAVQDMRRDGKEGATCDGGDVLYIPPKSLSMSGEGGDLFVGLSSRTNKAGLEFLERVFRSSSLVRNIIPIQYKKDGGDK